jgi:hypothetical protein
MDTDISGTETMTHEEAVPGQTGKPLPVVLTSTANLIQLQKQLKDVVTDNSEFCSTNSRTRIITKTMMDFSAVKSYLDNNNLAYFTFYPKFLKPVKVVICHLPFNTPAEDISDRMVSLSFDVISVRQMTATCWSPFKGSTTINLPLFLITLPRMAKSQVIFRLPSLCHIAIRVEAYKAQNDLTRCHNCQKFGHTGQTASNLPIVCGGHLHKECL